MQEIGRARGEDEGSEECECEGQANANPGQEVEGYVRGQVDLLRAELELEKNKTETLRAENAMLSNKLSKQRKMTAILSGRLAAFEKARSNAAMIVREAKNKLFKRCEYGTIKGNLKPCRNEGFLVKHLQEFDDNTDRILSLCNTCTERVKSRPDFGVSQSFRVLM